MARFIVLFILLVHGLIHLMGFAKAFKLADIQQLTQHISKAGGIGWLVSALLFVAAAVLFLLKKDIWWVVAAPAVIISQLLIFGAWQDAKFGTIANVIVLVGVVLGWAAWNFNRAADEAINTLWPKEPVRQEIITDAQLEVLPPVVQTWLRRSGVPGKEQILTAYLYQKGEMRTTPDGKWIPFTSEEYFNTKPPGFVWIADVKMMPGLNLKGLDTYQDSRGHMRIKLLGIIPIVDAAGEKTDQGTLLRYLGEICWIPTAVLSDYISWEQLDSTSAKATMTYGNITASGVFTFDENGDMIRFEADRYYERKEGATLERWEVRNTTYREFDGMRIPVSSEVTWKLKEGDYTWLKINITEFKYNSNLN